MADAAPFDGAPGLWQARATVARRAVLCLASPTWALADRLKGKRDEAGRTVLIGRLNRTYLAAAAIAALLNLVLGRNALSDHSSLWIDLVRAVWFGFLWSRCTAVFAAFYRDAFDKLDLKPADSGLNPSRRVRLALNSYAELVLNFALLYWLLPSSVWSGQAAPSSFTDILFYSASTTTTSGGGGFEPARWPLQLLTAYEIACGLILLVVCFAIYAGKALGEMPAAAAPSPAEVIPPAGPSGGSGPGTVPER